MNSYLPTHFNLTLGRGDMPPTLVHIDDGKLIYRSGYSLGVKVSPKPEQWREFWREIDDIGVWDWQPLYDDFTIIDGFSWALHMARDDREVSSSGFNKLPESGDTDASMTFRRLLYAVGRLLGGLDISL